ncbi:hypothetical protein LTR50_005525 [Elasticomyces elasticus]|nr:hypothetical protein LTR50_005525 [Elasticomyces elasticus]
MCIDKNNSEELSRTLRSMFQYYGEATVCYAFLDDIQKRTGFERVALKGKSQIELLQGEGANERRDSEWFAPKNMRFYDQDWQQLGAKSEFKPEIQRITRIESKYLESPDNLIHASVATKMSWMSGRTTALKEDIAYSLIGLFDVSMVPLYGEGVKAFFRLQDILIRDNAFDETLFAWSSGVKLRCFGRPDPWVDNEWGLLAPSPDCFAQSGDIVRRDAQGRLGGGIQLTNQGVTVQVPLQETKTRMGLDKKELEFPLHCTRNNKTIVLMLERTNRRNPIWKRVKCREGLKASSSAKVSNNRIFGIDQNLTSTVTSLYSTSVVIGVAHVMAPTCIQAFRLNSSIFNRTLFTRIHALWFADLPRAATAPTKAVVMRWFGAGSAADRAAFDADCTNGFKTALDSVGPEMLALPTFTTFEAERENAFAIAAPFLRLDDVRNEMDEGRAEIALSLILLLDQLSRNVFRDDQARIYRHYDRLSRALTQCVLATTPAPPQLKSNPFAAADRHADFKLLPAHRIWFYMPLMHSEDLADHDSFERLIADMRVAHQGDEAATKYLDTAAGSEKKHRSILERFGRYPYRNEVLGRATSAEERDWIQGGGDTFGTASKV